MNPAVKHGFPSKVRIVVSDLDTGETSLVMTAATETFVDNVLFIIQFGCATLRHTQPDIYPFLTENRRNFDFFSDALKILSFGR
ncbi:hypothetical protein MRB53_031532 [Persea americana]|uniref:Uncharacterized protein n=1 Tax=Persea americana TaxID=3435 RepID=A0ACC2KPC6_PERAE|nr:hypothetical protein MRB53_031532 [Persea americana]